jgi:hypothetical protein
MTLRTGDGADRGPGSVNAKIAAQRSAYLFEAVAQVEPRMAGLH